MSIFNKIIEFEGELFIIRRIIKESNKHLLYEWKSYIPCDVVLKQGIYLLLCERIKEAEIIESSSRAFLK